MKTKKNKIKKNKTKKNKSMKNKKKNKIGGAATNSTSKCSYYQNIEKKQKHKLETQEINQGIIESIERVIERVKVTPTDIDILHIIIGGNCQDPTEIAPGSIEYEYSIDCINSRQVTSIYSKKFFVINIDPESSPERSPGTEDRFLNLNYFHSKEDTCTYNKKLRELIIDILTRNPKAIVLIDNQIFLYLDPDVYDEMIYYLEPFAVMPSKQPLLNTDFFGELDENLQNRIIFSSYLKSSDLICPGRSEGKLRGKTTFMKYYYYLCELCAARARSMGENIPLPLTVKDLRKRKIEISLRYPDVLKLLIETKLKEIGRDFDGVITCEGLPENLFRV